MRTRALVAAARWVVVLAGVFVAAASVTAHFLHSPALARAVGQAGQGQVRVLGESQTRGSAGRPNGNQGGNGNGHSPFTITGSVTGLAPGTSRQLALVLSNPNDQAVRVDRLTVLVGTPTAASGRAATGCPSSALVVAPYAPASGTGVVVAGGGRATVSLPVAMSASSTSQDACKGVTFPLSYSGSATSTS